MSESLTVAEALALLPDREPNEDGRSLVHTQVESALGIIFGADGDREDVVALLEWAEAIYRAEGLAKAMGNALCVYERQAGGRVRRVFVEGAAEEEPR